MDVRLFSVALSMCTSVNVILPDRLRKPASGYGAKREGALSRRSTCCTV